MATGRNKKAAINSIVSLINLLITSIFSLVLGRVILSNLGSDYNGINATVNQLLYALTIIEGGFGTASVVAMFNPYVNKDDETMNKILSASNIRFKSISYITLGVGIAASIFCAFLVKTDISRVIVFAIVLLAILSMVFNLRFVNRYRLMFQVAQEEYSINIPTAILNICQQISAIILVIFTKNIILVRLAFFVFTLLTGLVIAILAKKRFKNVGFKHKPDFSLIKGTRDVFFGRATAIVYSSATILFISFFEGTKITSVYAVYYTVIFTIKNLISMVLASAQHGLGQVIAEGDKEKTANIFNEFEFIAIFMAGLLFSCTFALIIPFIRIYTHSITDIDYIQFWIPAILVMTSFIELLHIPSGQSINMSGRFKVAKNIQLTALISLLVLDLIGVLAIGFYGIISANLIVALLLAVLEIGYARKNIVQEKKAAFIKTLAFNIGLFLAISILEFLFFHDKSLTIVQFILAGFCVLTINSLLFIILNAIINKTLIRSVISRIKSIIKRSNKKGAL